MAQDTTKTDDEQGSDLTAKIERIEVANTEIDLSEPDRDLEKHDVSKRYDDPRVRIIFESGGILQIRQGEDMDVPVEESFKPNDPHSVYESYALNGFIYEDDWEAATCVQRAAEWNIEEMARRSVFVSDIEQDWENLANCFEKADQ